MPRRFSQKSPPKSSQHEAACSQNSQQSQISEVELQVLVNKCITKILAENFSLRSYKKSDIFSGAKVKGRAAKQLVDAVKTKLLNIYGLNLIEHDNKFILLNPNSKVLDQFTPHYTSANDHVFLGILLALIVHHNDEITADDLSSFFGALGILTEGDDSYFGNIKKLLHELEQQHYIEKTVRPIPSQVSEVTYKWGLRSKHEVKKKSLIPIVGMMYQMAPEDLPRPLIRLFSDEEV